MQVTILEINKVLICPLQGEILDLHVQQIQEEIIARLYKSGAKGVILDVSGLSLIDSFLGRVLVEITRMVKIMGAKAAITGITPHVAITIVELGLPLEHLRTFGSVEEAISYIGSEWE
ncbi:STAS domain-containing protein [Carboxydothermus pertinax]|uniref:Anti-anti-sigma factor n=1 Tax=Carboxydothermus pertinax TaxID=870242 RepID=A0A1L8CTU3_9THEO|nr:STAS domain-containing protein [Carboxydothermus pertinax]GAV22249.1 anti-anti-sigma factor [Carboxydothermus pertinax]